MENIHWFDNPTQVKVYDCIEDNEVCFFNAIGFENKVICACCGMILDIEDIYANADEDNYVGAVLIPFDEWVDFSDYIGSGE